MKKIIYYAISYLLNLNKYSKSINLKCIDILYIKKLLFLLFFLIIFLFQNCSTYLQYRKKDLQDVVTLGLEKPGYGLGMRISVIPIGFYFQGGQSSPGKLDIGEGYGLRGGNFSRYTSQQLVFGFLGGETFFSGNPKLSDNGEPIKEDTVIQTESDRDNLKSYNVKYLKIFSDPPKERQKRSKEKTKKVITETLLKNNSNPALLAYIPVESKKPNGYPSEYKYQVELFFSLYYGFRIGINFSELVDFLLGFTTLDILEDDIQN
jgi:hypothetical protein